MDLEKPSFRKAMEQMQADDSIEVIFYSGYKADESPREILVKGKRFQIEEVMERRRERRENRIYDIFFCRLQGLVVRLEKPEGGTWKIKIIEK